MPVFKYKGIKIVTDASDLQAVLGRLPKAHQTLEQLKREIDGLPPGVYRKQNPGLGFEVSVISGSDQIDILGVPPPKPIPPELMRVELIPQYKFAPAFYAISEETKEYVGVVLAKGAGWGPPYFLLRLDSMDRLYDQRYQNFASYSNFATGRDDGPWYRYPEDSADGWTQYREKKSRFLGVAPSKKAIGDPPALVIPWEIPARGEYIAATGWIPPEFEWRDKYTACTTVQTYPYNCDTGGAMSFKLGNQTYYSERPIWYQAREIPYGEFGTFPCGATVVGLPEGKARTDQAEMQWRWACDWFSWCVHYPCGHGDCYRPTPCGQHFMQIGLGIAECKSVCGGYNPSWLGGSQYQWNYFHSYEYISNYTFTTVYSPWYGSVLLNGVEGGMLYYTYEYTSTTHRWKEFIPVHNECFHVTNDLSGGSEKSEPTSHTTEKEEAIWCDGKDYPTGYSTYGDFEYYKMHAGYYKLPTGGQGTEETVFLLSVRRDKDEWQKWSFYYVGPSRIANPMMVEEFDFFSFEGDARKFIIPGILYKKARLIGDGRYAMVAYLEQALQDDIKEVF